MTDIPPQTKWQAFKLGAAVIIGLPLLLFSLPVTLPIAVSKGWLVARRRRQVATETKCSVCSVTLGASALELADARYAELLQRLHAEHPGMKLRIERHLYAVCTNCGAKYDYDEKRNMFILLKEDGAGAL